MTYGVKTLPDGSKMYDDNVLKPELAESWAVAPDGMSVTFKLRKDAKFHDGTPVSAKDVKWSFDRAVTVGGFPTFQMKAGSLEKPEQFEVVAEEQRRGQRRLQARVVEARSGDDLHALRRLEVRPPPQAQARDLREVPSAGNRRALLERGDADISFDLPPKDFAEIAKAGKLQVVSHPVENAFAYVGMNVKNPPFNTLKVRQAVAHVVPFEKMFTSAIFARRAAEWQPDREPHRRPRADADPVQDTTNEPMAVLLQESLAQIGIKTTINKIPGSNWRTMLLKKEMPLFINAFGGWLNYPEYFDTDPTKYMEDVRGFAKLAVADVPRVLKLVARRLIVAVPGIMGGS